MKKLLLVGSMLLLGTAAQAQDSLTFQPWFAVNNVTCVSASIKNGVTEPTSRKTFQGRVKFEYFFADKLTVTVETMNPRDEFATMQTSVVPQAGRRSGALANITGTSWEQSSIPEGIEAYFDSLFVSDQRLTMSLGYSRDKRFSDDLKLGLGVSCNLQGRISRRELNMLLNGVALANGVRSDAETQINEALSTETARQAPFNCGSGRCRR